MKSCKKHPDAKRYKSGACSACAIEAQKRYAEKHPERVRARFREWRNQNTDQHRAVVRAGHHKKAGIDPVVAAARLASNNGRCDCCGKAVSEKLGRCVDHDHTTGRIRGILCHHCNLGIGRLGDTLESLKRAVSYLEKGAAQ